MKKVFIYALLDPITKNIKYIGKTEYTLEKRFKEHLKDGNKKTYKNKWINSLYNKGLTPEIILIEEVNENIWKEKEIFYISLFRSMGSKLTNISKGGEGGGSIGYKHTKEWKEAQKLRLIKRNKEKPLGKEFYEELNGKKRIPIIQLDLENNFIKEFISTAEAASSLVYLQKDRNVIKTANAITNCLKNRNKKAYNFKWIYK